jgi:hypothetical protein
MGPFDVHLQYLLGEDGFRISSGTSGETTVLVDTWTAAVEFVYWFRRAGHGVRIRAEAGEKKGFYDRRGVELGLIFPGF